MLLATARSREEWACSPMFVMFLWLNVRSVILGDIEPGLIKSGSWEDFRPLRAASVGPTWWSRWSSRNGSEAELTKSRVRVPSTCTLRGYEVRSGTVATVATVATTV